MPRTNKYKGTRSRPVVLYLWALALFGVAGFLGVTKEYDIDFFANLGIVFRTEPPVKWVTRTEALASCERLKKPILYVVLTKGTTASNRIYYEHLNNPEIYNFINENFLPVKAEIKSRGNYSDIDKKEGWSNFSGQINGNGWGYGYAEGGFMVVPYKMKNATGGDIASCANLTELGYL